MSVVIAAIPLMLTTAMKSYCYTSLGYADAFTALHEDMKAHYALQGWKETDFNAKYEEYIGLFEEAEQNDDKTAYILTMLSYLASYQDGHVQMGDMYEIIGIGSTRNIQDAYAQIYKNYYGMTLLRLDSGEYVAANVEEDSSADRVGIKNGTVITKWNGADIAEQLAQMKYIIPVNCSRFADTENIERFKPFCLSCMGEKQIEAEFLDEQKKRKSVTLASMGNGYKYLYNTIGLFLQKDKTKEADISYDTLENHVGYLQIKAMGDDYDGIRSEIEGYIAEMKKEQISSLIIDVRNNEGGEDDAGVVIACLDEDGGIMIDSKYQGTGGIKPEVVIPVNQEAVEKIFEEDYDYELEYLLKKII